MLSKTLALLALCAIQTQAVNLATSISAQEAKLDVDECLAQLGDCEDCGTQPDFALAQIGDCEDCVPPTLEGLA